MDAAAALLAMGSSAHAGGVDLNPPLGPVGSYAADGGSSRLSAMAAVAASPAFAVSARTPRSSKSKSKSGRTPRSSQRSDGESPDDANVMGKASYRKRSSYWEQRSKRAAIGTGYGCASDEEEGRIPARSVWSSVPTVRLSEDSSSSRHSDATWWRRRWTCRPSKS